MSLAELRLAGTEVQSRRQFLGETVNVALEAAVRTDGVFKSRAEARTAAIILTPDAEALAAESGPVLVVIEQVTKADGGLGFRPRELVVPPQLGSTAPEQHIPYSLFATGRRVPEALATDGFTMLNTKVMQGERMIGFGVTDTDWVFNPDGNSIPPQLRIDWSFGLPWTGSGGYFRREFLYCLEETSVSSRWGTIDDKTVLWTDFNGGILAPARDGNWVGGIGRSARNWVPAVGGSQVEERYHGWYGWNTANTSQVFGSGGPGRFHFPIATSSIFLPKVSAQGEGAKAGLTRRDLLGIFFGGTA